MSQDPVSPSVDLEDLLQSIRDVESELDAASDDFGERIRLREGLRELKAIASRLSQTGRTRADVAIELDHLKRLRARSSMDT